MANAATTEVVPQPQYNNEPIVIFGFGKKELEERKCKATCRRLILLCGTDIG